MAKDQMSDEVYDTQSRLFEFLVKKGVVLQMKVLGFCYKEQYIKGDYKEHNSLQDLLQHN